MTDINWTTVANVIQSVGVIGALFFTCLEMRKRTREQRFERYAAGLSGFIDLARLMVERPELHDLYVESNKDLDPTYTYEMMTSEERAKVLYSDTIIALCETVWLAGREGHLEKDEWLFWQRWARELSGSRYFRWTVNAAEHEEEYDLDFLAELKREERTTTAATTG
jgi:hypothetical protein